MGSRSHRMLEAIGRYGGDEFVALLPEVADERDAERVAHRVLELMKAPIIVGGQSASSPRAWALPFPRDGASVTDLMRASDVAMYAAKSQGPNSHSLYTPMLAGRGARRSSSRAHCTRRSSATNWCCTTSPRWMREA